MAAETELTISSGGTSVTIWATKIDHNLDKPLINIPMPRQRQGTTEFQESSTTTFLIDIGRVKEIVTVQGYLADESSESAKKKKDNLWTLAKTKRELTIAWGTGSRAESLTGNINKIGITETAGIIGEEQASGYESEKNFAIQLAFMIGEAK